ncbi:hypothetical protein BBJ29_002324 [Phytophthora kernoviae]|uniref:Uncharacterized protein n=1 Tax=Phytophthora kernoviae TaxID=325452 RepID=A0A3F2RJE8_9STRA|nr:hypothetical protein BBJ29_002324 [Phytophthora kernoviae]RLN58440.1 hypothetical protein BBP00_00007001 [Phytophthora kernoviae]
MPATRSDTNAATQETTALVPLSMSLVAKKEKILKIEKEKLEKRLRERTKLLCGLRESHEHLLKTNGHLQERNRLRKEKLLSLRMELEDEQSLKGTNKSAVCGTTELEAIAEKCGMLKDLLDALAKKHVALEQSCMNLEERTSRETSTLAVKNERLNEGTERGKNSRVNETTATQYIRRELALRTKQENGILAITQSTIKAKDEQLTWLERQRVHLANEQKEMMEAYAGDEAAYNEFLASHTKEMDTLAAEIEDVEKQAKAAERSIPAREKKVVAINKKIAQKKRVLGSWNEKNREKQEQLAWSTATKTLVDSEELGLQEALKREQLGLESIMQQNAVREMEAEDLLSSCASLEANIRQANKTLPIMKSNIAAAETSVKNRIDEIRDKFLNSFVISDSGNLIELLNKEVRSAVGAS